MPGYSPTSKQWHPELDMSLPISGGDLPHFKAWVNGYGFFFGRDNPDGHDGFDFGAYVRTDGVVVVGLPETTPVRAVADGVVNEIYGRNVWGGYACSIRLEHGSDEHNRSSGYTHVVPTVSERMAVQKGDVIGTLHKDPGQDTGRLVHLHLSLIDGFQGDGVASYVDMVHDPGLIDPSIYDNTVEPQGWKPFDPSQVVGATALELAHFSEVRVNDSVWHA
jgi:murein DD-endopeptidase MepM/ murein hydrolase activator NlpD